MPQIDEPRNARSRRTRSAILDAAWRLIGEHGAEDIAMEVIAHEAGVTRKAVYLHFSSKTELLLALREHMDQVLNLEASVRPILEARAPAEMLDAWARHVARYHARIHPVVRAIDRARRTDEAAAVLWDQVMKAWRGACRSVVARIARQGMLAQPWTVASATDLLWALMSVDLLEDLMHDRGWSERRFATHLAVIARRTLLEES